MQQELTRREALKRGAMTAGALAWATPVMQVVGISPAYAEETSPGDEDCCIDAEGNTIKLALLDMKYLGDDNFCDGNFTQDPSLVSCTDYLDPMTDTLPISVYIVASHQEFPFQSDGIPKPAARIWFEGDVIQDNTFPIDAEYASETRLKGETWVHIFSEDPTDNPSFEDLYLQKVAFHTSCSEPLFTGDVFGSVELVGCEPEDPNATLTEPVGQIQELEEGQETEELEESGVEETEESEGPEKPEAPEQSQAPGQSQSEDGPGNSGTSQSTVPEEAEGSTISSVPEGEVSEEDASD